MKPSGVIVAACYLTLLAACKKSEDKKDNDDNNKNNSPTAQLLIAGKWQLSGATLTTTYMGKDTTMDAMDQIPECDRDDVIQFADNGTATVDEHINKCPDDNQVEIVTWTLLNDDKKLALIDSNPDTFDLEVNNTLMKLKLTKPNSSGVPVTAMQTFKNVK